MFESRSHKIETQIKLVGTGVSDGPLYDLRNGPSNTSVSNDTFLLMRTGSAP